MVLVTAVRERDARTHKLHGKHLKWRMPEAKAISAGWRCLCTSGLQFQLTSILPWASIVR